MILRNCKVSWGANPPDAFSYAVEDLKPHNRVSDRWPHKAGPQPIPPSERRYLSYESNLSGNNGFGVCACRLVAQRTTSPHARRTSARSRHHRACYTRRASCRPPRGRRRPGPSSRSSSSRQHDPPHRRQARRLVDGPRQLRHRHGPTLPTTAHPDHKPDPRTSTSKSKSAGSRASTASTSSMRPTTITGTSHRPGLHNDIFELVVDGDLSGGPLIAASSPTKNSASGTRTSPCTASRRRTTTS